MRSSKGLCLLAAVILAGCPNGASSTTDTPPLADSTTLETGTTAPTVPATRAPGRTTSTSQIDNPDPSTGAIGVVGCSNTSIAVGGYSEISSKDLLAQGGLTNGSLAVWANPRPARYERYWGLYDERRPSTGYTGTWFQMCIRDTEHEGAFDTSEQEWIRHIVTEIHERDPGIPIWISGVNSYAAGVVCPSVGPDGPQIASEAADWAADSIDGVIRGPDLGPLSEDEVDSDSGCHPNTLGQELLGQQLVEFFDQS